MNARDRNNRCVNCGGTVPGRVAVERDQDYRQYYCPDCDDTVMEQAIAFDGRAANLPDYVNVPQHPAEGRFRLPQGGNWVRAAATWTDFGIVYTIHGRLVSGSENLHRIVVNIERRVDESD
jgi:DNA-directed RNA polymerase subunit RPC12/RpoP